MGRDKSSEEDARNRMNAQLPLDMKRNKADIVIDNTGSLDYLNEQFQNVLIEVSKPFTWTQAIHHFTCHYGVQYYIMAVSPKGFGAALPLSCSRKAASFKLLSTTNQNPLHHHCFPRTLLKKYQLQLPRGSSACCSAPVKIGGGFRCSKMQ
ncbi:hypothetical protein PIB30_058947 [Stylosanthes scabra]|uniref:Dephospho-CoA kinase n=1 Tax=Stylosanthes scabra TaxID=79078 RepID=A0ABU6YIB3_9FABA|nr:hypothetical protein [Stylosanthes scabra]